VLKPQYPGYFRYPEAIRQVIYMTNAIAGKWGRFISWNALRQHERLIHNLA